jgi:hypothetical protein
MSSTLTIQGLTDLRTALRELPRALLAEARAIVEDTAEEAISEMRGLYPRFTGNLREGLTIEHRGSQVGTATIVRNKAKHAMIFERGTEARHTKDGWNRGRMPAGKVFIPTAMKHRRRMRAAQVALVRRAGFQVVDAEI